MIKQAAILKESTRGTCSNCINANEGVCSDCPDEKGILGTTEISDLGTCKNWKKKETD